MRSEDHQGQELSPQWPRGYLLSLSSAPGGFCIASPGCTLEIKALRLSLVGKAQHSIWNLDLAPGNTIMYARASYFAP